MIDAAKALDVPISSFHFGSGYTSIGRKRYVFTWNRAKFPEPKALTRAFADAGMKVVANVKPCLLDDHPRYGEVAAAGGFIAGGDDHAPLKSQFWDGEGAHVDFTNPAGVAWWKEGLTRQVARLRRRRGVERQQRIRACGTTTRPAPASASRRRSR